MTTKRRVAGRMGACLAAVAWFGVASIGVAWMASPAAAQVKQLGRISVPATGRVAPASHCNGCSDLGPLWSPASCDGGCDVVPPITGPACRPCCRDVVGDFLCGVKNGVDRTLQCVIGAIIPCGLCQGSYDICSATACSGCAPPCDSCCDLGCTDGCDSGCTGGCSDGYGGGIHSIPTGVPTPAVADPFQDDPPAPATSSARAVRRAPSAMTQAQRSAAQRRPQIRRTNYQRPTAQP